MAAAQTIYAATVAVLLPPYIRKDRGWLPESWRKVFAESLGDVQAFLEAWHDFVSAFYEVSSGNLRAVLFDKLDHARPPDLNETKWEASITASLRASSDEQYQFGQEVWEAYLLDCDNDIIYDQTNTFGTLIIRERGYVRHNRHTNLSGTDLKGARRLYAEARKLGFYI